MKVKLSLRDSDGTGESESEGDPVTGVLRETVPLGTVFVAVGSLVADIERLGDLLFLMVDVTLWMV